MEILNIGRDWLNSCTTKVDGLLANWDVIMSRLTETDYPCTMIVSVTRLVYLKAQPKGARPLQPLVRPFNMMQSGKGIHMSEQKLRIGIIGIGWYAATVLIPTLLATGRAELVAIARRRADRLALAQQELQIGEAYTDWREMLDKSALDAVVVCTPPNAHTEPTVAALERGLHVFVEKPMALTNADAHRNR